MAIVEEWNDTKRPYPEKTLHSLFEAQVARTPDATALICGTQHLTFRELNQRANQLANYLQARLIGRGSLVGVCVQRSFDMIIAVLGVLKAGAAYLPLDPTYPPERLSFMLSDSKTDLLLTQTALREQLPSGIADVVCLDWIEVELARHDTANPVTATTPDDWCFVIYTSGSTGLPKGVGSSHRASVVMFFWIAEVYPFAPGEAFCQRTTLNFVVSVWEIFLPLLQGVRVVIVPDAQVQNPAQLLAYLGEQRVTRILLVPSLLRTLINTGGDLFHLVPELKLWVLVGEILPPDLAAKFRQRLPAATLLNLYGCTETHSALAYEVNGDARESFSIPVGKPLANRRVYVLDRTLNPVPAGAPGELYVAGDGLSRGYVNRPELTAQRFLPDPFSPLEGALLYRTGDRGRYRSDGNIELLGRTDNQVQIRGFRVELGEVEAALQQYPSIGQCVVNAVDDADGDRRLVAYIVPLGSRPSVTLMREHLQKSLPDHMIPTIFMFVEALPLTPNGKIDRQALPPPDNRRPELLEQYAPPKSDTEQALAEIWAKALNIERVGVRDSFFDLGGYSNKALLVLMHVRNRFGVELPLKAIFELQTVARLAERVEAAMWLAKGVSPPVSSERVTGEIL